MRDMGHDSGSGRETDGMTLELGMLHLFILRRPLAGLVASRSWEGHSLVGLSGCELVKSALAWGYPSLVGRRTWRLLVGGEGGQGREGGGEGLYIEVETIEADSNIVFLF